RSAAFQLLTLVRLPSMVAPDGRCTEADEKDRTSERQHSPCGGGLVEEHHRPSEIDHRQDDAHEDQLDARIDVRALPDHSLVVMAKLRTIVTKDLQPGAVRAAA